jgi:hypothetical protein
MRDFWDTAPCSLVWVRWRLRGTYCFHHKVMKPGHGGSTHLWNVGLLQWKYTALYLRKLSSSYWPPSEPEISHNTITDYGPDGQSLILGRSTSPRSDRFWGPLRRLFKGCRGYGSQSWPLASNSAEIKNVRRGVECSAVQYSGGVALPILNLGSRWRRGAASQSGRVTPGDETPGTLRATEPVRSGWRRSG